MDVDFPSVWRELAGLDSILQAAGRCNREGKRSAAESVVHVFETEGKFPTSMIQQREAAMEVMGEFDRDQHPSRDSGIFQSAALGEGRRCARMQSGF